MKADKAFILKTPDKRSEIYAKDVADSCDKIGLEWEYVNWYQGEPEKAWKEVNIKFSKPPKGSPPAQCCYSGHIRIWQKIIEYGKPAIVLEHDGMMLHKPEIDIPDGQCVLLGYKLKDTSRYDHVSAGPPNAIIDNLGGGHEGSHAYAITPATAQMWIDEVTKRGITRPIDNEYFLKTRSKTTTRIGQKIMSPTPAIGWLRESTIQRNSAERNYPFIPSFQKYLKA